MTTIFTYPLSNAWVIASDKLETNQTESERQKRDHETRPHNTTTKISSKNGFVLGLSGSSADIDKIEKILFSNINKTFKLKTFKKIVLQQYRENINSLDTELLLIDSQKIKAYKISMKNLPTVLSDAQIESIEQGYIGSGALKSQAKYQTSPLLDVLKDLRIKNSSSKKVKNLLAKTVIAMEILAKQDTQFTGHPAIYGCNIIIVIKNRILSYKILPKRYVCKELNQTNWFNLEELEDA